MSLILIGLLIEKRILVVLLIGFLIFPFILPKEINNRFKTIFNFNDYLTPGRVLIERPFVWEASLRMIRDYPILGAGTGTQTFYALYVEREYKPQPAKQLLGHAHNQILQTMVETGVLGLLSFIWIFTIILRSIFRSLKEVSNPSFEKYMFAGIFAALAGLFIHGFAGSFLRSRMGILLWIMIGFLYGSY